MRIKTHLTLCPLLTGGRFFHHASKRIDLRAGRRGRKVARGKRRQTRHPWKDEEIFRILEGCRIMLSSSAAPSARYYFFTRYQGYRTACSTPGYLPAALSARREKNDPQ